MDHRPSFGAKSGTVTVASDDPAGPRTIQLSGFVPSGKLTVTGVELDSTGEHVAPYAESVVLVRFASQRRISAAW